MFLRLSNEPRQYDWGSTADIAQALGRTPSGQPEAELWLGTHPADPAELLPSEPSVAAQPESVDLREYLQEHPLPGGATELPFLLKLLAAARPLSLQAHPSKAQAEVGFKRENAAGIPLDAAARNYKDANHKPELIVAVSDTFEALSGFRPLDETTRVLRQLAQAGQDAGLDVSALAEFVASLEVRVAQSDAVAMGWALQWLLTDPAAHGVATVVTRAAEITTPVIEGTEPDTIRRISEVYASDPGVVLALFLHRVSLRRGEALYLPAGNLHAYLEGLGVELMAASDNVLRGGLTSKHIDVAELASVVLTEPLPAPRLLPEQIAPGVQRFAPDVPDFELWHVSSEHLANLELPSASILLNLGKSAELVGARSSIRLGRGDSVFIPAEELPVQLSGADVFIASGGSPR